MRGQLILTLVLVSGFQFAYSILSTEWGITSDIERLRFVMRDLFHEAFRIVADDVYTLPDIKYTYDHTVRNNTGTVQFRAYNGRFHNPTLDIVQEHGRLRRMVIANENLRQHELIVCGDCLLMETQRLNYLYEAYYGKHSTYGKIYNGPVAYFLGFEMAVIRNNENQTNNVPTCKLHIPKFTTTLESLHRRYELLPKIENIGVLNFLADKKDTWIIQHLNTTVKNNLQTSIINAIEAVAKKHRICDEVLTA